MLQIQQIAYPTHIWQVAKTSILGSILGSMLPPFWGYVLLWGFSRRHQQKLLKNGLPQIPQKYSKMGSKWVDRFKGKHVFEGPVGRLGPEGLPRLSQMQKINQNTPKMHPKLKNRQKKI